MTTEIAKQKQWFDNKILLIVLFFILPPLGIYGMIKHKTDSWKKILYIVPSAIFTLLVIIGIVGAVFIDNYKQGVDYYNKKEYIKAYESLSRVSQDDKNYSDAISKINEIKPIVDSLKIVEENEKIAKENAEKAENEIKNSEKTAKENKEKIRDNPSLAFPKTQQDFLSVLQSTENEYKEQPNELKKSAVKTKRGNLIKNALGNTRNFVEWIGIVRNMETTSKGKAIFEVELEGTGVTIMTMNNEFSDLFGNTLIDQKNPLYNIIAELKKGDKVRVSGEFVESPENDYVYELSMTESGSMKNPDFIVKFNKVIKQ
ncbi:hypothetical protein [Flavobacterium sp.]|uniref:hypothetical protein n=1 Tax=Flavobacterium sp. TaxID=239 RepID=UPI00286E1779|nr:hypothetical protein [Flavobacterium sp.]